MEAATHTAAIGTDPELVSASLQGDREAFGRIVARYQSLVCSLAYSATGSLTRSEDLAQETFLEAWKALGSLREPEKLRSWLCSIARNRIHQSLRTGKREPAHEAEPLEQLEQAPCSEPLPSERAINREEADILWHRLEQLPETYRLPLVLYYREQQSIEKVAQSLELSEEAARQRLSRARKLLQEEVQAFVETALTRTAPGKTFTLGVVAALPLMATSAKAASGLAAAKGTASLKSMFLLPLVAGLASMVGPVALSWKFAADDAQTAGERKLRRRIGRGQVLLLLVLLVLVAIPAALSASGGHGFFWLSVALFTAVILVLVINSAVLLPWMVRRQVEMRMEEGIWTDPAMEAASEKTAHRAALRKAFKHGLPATLLAVVCCAFFLPWSKNWLGCAAYLSVPILPALWHTRKLYRQFRGQVIPSPLLTRLSATHPLLTMVAGAFLTILICVVLSNLLVRYLGWLNTGTVPDLPLTGAPTGQLLLGCVITLLILGFLAIIARRLPSLLSGLGRLLRLPFLEQIKMSFGSPTMILENTYRALFEELKLDPERIRLLKELLLKRVMVGVRAGMPLANRSLEKEKRAALLRDVQADKDACTTQIRDFLGPQAFTTFLEFERGIPDRTLVEQFNRKTAQTAQALTEDQSSHLLEARLSARRRYPWTSELALQNQNLSLQEVYTPSNVEAYIREQSHFDELFLPEAERILTPEQLEVFEKIQTRQRESQISQFRMGLKMFGNATAG